MIAGSPGRRLERKAMARAVSVALAAFACGSLPGGPSGNDYEDLVRQNAAARENLVFGMSREEAAAVMGASRIIPPWANGRKIGPQVVENPLDTLDFESPSGDRYEVQRYAVGLTGERRCPFIRGEAELVPLIFFEDKLVGWRWSYLASALQRRLKIDEQSWSFGAFCGARATEAKP